jgi:phosphoribosyl 1,2-cyclic phosphodiesterase
VKGEGSFLKFIGTAGARFVVIKQLRASGGTWISSGSTNLYLDPGPGALVRCLSSRPRLDPSKLDGILLSHRHLDHSGDVNIMIEAMSQGGFKKKGILFAPHDALGEGGVVFDYVIEYLENVQVLESNRTYRLGDLTFSTGGAHLHSVETYGFNFRFPEVEVSFITDTRFRPDIVDMYTGPIMVINVVRFLPPDNANIDHMSIPDVKRIIEKRSPRLTVLTHFGMTMIKEKPWKVAEKLGEETGSKVVAARDGMRLNLADFA